MGDFIRKVGNEFANSPLNFRNRIFHSRVTDFARDEMDSGLSIKFVLQGSEHYRIGNSNHSIAAGNYLIVNEHQQFNCRVKAREVVEGICIYLDPETVREVYHCRTQSQIELLDKGEDSSGPEMEFFEKVYSVHENSLGNFLNVHLPYLRDPELRSELDVQAFFLQLSERLVEGHLEVSGQMRGMEQEKPSTREELFRRISRARNFIDAHFLDELSLDRLAEISHLSKYHFLRCFKQIYGRSPYQYVIAKRLERGRDLLKHKHYSLTEIAYQTGFSDRRAFNKAFRKAFGIGPSDLRNWDMFERKSLS